MVWNGTQIRPFGTLRRSALSFLAAILPFLRGRGFRPLRALANHTALGLDGKGDSWSVGPGGRCRIRVIGGISRPPPADRRPKNGGRGGPIGRPPPDAIGAPMRRTGRGHSAGAMPGVSRLPSVPCFCNVHHSAGTAPLRFGAASRCQPSHSGNAGVNPRSGVGLVFLRPHGVPVVDGCSGIHRCRMTRSEGLLR